MKQDDFLVVFQQTAREFGLKVSKEEVRIILAILEESLIKSGSKLNADESILVGRFLKIAKVSSVSRTGVIQKGEHKGKLFVSAPAEYISFEASDSFKKKTRDRDGETKIGEE